MGRTSRVKSTGSPPATRFGAESGSRKNRVQAINRRMRPSPFRPGPISCDSSRARMLGQGVRDFIYLIGSQKRPPMPFPSSEILSYQPPKTVRVADLVHGSAKGREIGQEFREVAAGARQPAQGDLRTVQAKFTLHQLQE